MDFSGTAICTRQIASIVFVIFMNDRATGISYRKVFFHALTSMVT